MAKTRINSQEPTDAMILASRIAVPDDRRLYLRGEYDPLLNWRTLSSLVARSPQNLRAHAQRLLLTRNSMFTPSLKGALNDLAIALNGQGSSFAVSILQALEDKLTEEDYSCYLTMFSDGVKPDLMYQCREQGSVLANGACEGHALVISTADQERAGFASPLEEARSCMEYGQLEEALQILETEMLAHPDDEAIEAELINLYHYLRDKQQFQSMTDKLREAGIPLSEAWQQCQQEAGDWI